MKGLFVSVGRVFYQLVQLRTVRDVRALLLHLQERQRCPGRDALAMVFPVHCCVQFLKSIGVLVLVNGVQFLVFRHRFALSKIETYIVVIKSIFVVPRVLFNRHKLVGVLRIESMILLRIIKLQVLTARWEEVRTVIDIDEIRIRGELSNLLNVDLVVPHINFIPYFQQLLFVV